MVVGIVFLGIPIDPAAADWLLLAVVIMLGPVAIVGSLLATGALVTLAGIGVFRVSERRAKDRGLLDRTTGS